MVAWDTVILHCYGPGTEEISKHLDKDYLDNITVPCTNWHDVNR